MTLALSTDVNTVVTVRADQYQGKEIARAEVRPGMTGVTVPLTAGLVGRHAVYFEFHAPRGSAGIVLDRFTFDD